MLLFFTRCRDEDQKGGAHPGGATCPVLWNQPDTARGDEKPQPARREMIRSLSFSVRYNDRVSAAAAHNRTAADGCKRLLGGPLQFDTNRSNDDFGRTLEKYYSSSVSQRACQTRRNSPFSRVASRW